MIGSLMYLTASRPDIMFAVCACARFQVTPKASHLNAVKRIFRYLKHQPKLGLWYPRDSPFVLEAFSDSDYGGASLDRKSTTDLLTKGFDVTRFNFLVVSIKMLNLTSMNLRMDGRCAGSLSHIWSVSDKYKRKVNTDMSLVNIDKHNMVAFLKKPTESIGFTEIVDFLKSTSLRYALSHNPTIYNSLVKQFWQTATVRTLANGIQELIASIDNKEYTITEASIRSQLQLVDATGISNLPDAEIYEGLVTLRGFAGEHVPLLPAMLAGAAPDQGEGSAIPAGSQPTPDLVPFIITPPPISEPQPSSPLDEETTTSVGVETKEATTTTSGLDAGMDSELMDIVPKLVLRIDNLEKELQHTKSTYRKAVLTLVERVKLLEAAFKRKSLKVILNSMEEKEAGFVTPKKVSASGEAQEEDISPTTLEAAKTLSKVASQNVSTYKRRARLASKGKDIGIGLDFFSAAKERLKSAEVKVNTEVNPGSTRVNTGNTPAL
ncbi:hypothetical protein Tco_0667099 [Tanacetum coccineum]